jgi:hypothetical protein
MEEKGTAGLTLDNISETLSGLPQADFTDCEFSLTSHVSSVPSQSGNILKLHKQEMSKPPQPWRLHPRVSKRVPETSRNVRRADLPINKGAIRRSSSVVRAISVLMDPGRAANNMRQPRFVMITLQTTSTHRDQRPIGRTVDEETCGLVRSRPSLKCAALTLAGTYLPLTA